MNKFHNSKHNMVTILSISNLDHYIYSRSHIIHPLNKAFQHLIKCIKYHYPEFDFIIKVLPPNTKQTMLLVFNAQERNDALPFSP